MAYERSQLIAPAVASATAVHAAVTLTAAAQSVTTGITSPVTYRAVSVKGNQASVTGNVVVTGTDWNGGTVTDTIALSGASAVPGVRAMKTVVSILLPALAAAGDTVSVGIADVFGLQGTIAAQADVLLQERAASGATEFTIESTGTVSATYDTVATAITAGDRVRWTYLDSASAAAESALFTVAEARAFDKAQLANATTYTDAAIQAAEVGIREKFSRVCGVAFVPTVTTEYLDGSGSCELFLRSHNPYGESPGRGVTVSAVSVTDTAGTVTTFTAADLADLICYPYKIVRRTLGYFTWGRRNVAVTYTHGYTAVPTDIKRAALMALVRELVPSNLPWEASMGADGHVNWSMVPDSSRERWFAIPYVDNALKTCREQELLPGMA